MNKYAAIEEKPELCRLTLAKNTAPLKVERDGGDYKAGIIRGVSAMTEGEALGHEAWVDAELLDQVVKSGNAQRGVKSRFTHPGLSSDGLGTLTGRFKSFQHIDKKALGDWHFVKSAHKTPKGDLAEYVMDVAEETPDMVAMSIVFERDLGAEKQFEGAHSDKDGNFVSPEKANKNNFPHFRLARLLGVDIVDEPAANPDGLFAALNDGNELPAVAEQALKYAFGLSEDAPDAAILGIHPERIHAFLRGFIQRNGLFVGSTNDFGLIPSAEDTQATSQDDDEWLTGESPYRLADSTTTEYRLADSTTTEYRLADSTTTDGSDIEDINSEIESDPMGADSHIPHKEGSEMDDLKDLTVERLEDERPDLVEEIQAEWRDDAKSEAEEQVADAVAEERERCAKIVDEAERLELLSGIADVLRSDASVEKAELELTRAKLGEIKQGVALSAKVVPNADTEPLAQEPQEPKLKAIGKDRELEAAGERAKALGKEIPGMTYSAALTQALREQEDKKEGK
jgi:hypothetical protein